MKRTFSFIGDLKLYETCPRQYQFFHEFDFTPSRSAVIFFGQLVHQTIEEIHRFVLDGKRRPLRLPLLLQGIRRPPGRTDGPPETGPTCVGSCG